MSRSRAARVAAWMTALSPGASPPPVLMAILRTVFDIAGQHCGPRKGAQDVRARPVSPEGSAVAARPRANLDDPRHGTHVGARDPYAPMQFICRHGPGARPVSCSGAAHLSIEGAFPMRVATVAFLGLLSVSAAAASACGSVNQVSGSGTTGSGGGG